MATRTVVGGIEAEQTLKALHLLEALHLLKLDVELVRAVEQLGPMEFGYAGLDAGATDIYLSLQEKGASEDVKAAETEPIKWKRIPIDSRCPARQPGF